MQQLNWQLLSEEKVFESDENNLRLVWRAKFLENVEKYQMSHFYGTKKIEIGV